MALPVSVLLRKRGSFRLFLHLKTYRDACVASRPWRVRSQLAPLIGLIREMYKKYTNPSQKAGVVLQCDDTVNDGYRFYGLKDALYYRFTALFLSHYFLLFSILVRGGSCME